MNLKIRNILSNRVIRSSLKARLKNMNDGKIENKSTIAKMENGYNKKACHLGRVGFL